MTENTLIHFNDVFFYGLILHEREVEDIRSDIFASVLMRYLRSLEPVSRKLYRKSGDDKYEYNYSFIPTKPLYWRVIKNRRIIEEVEQLSDGKYCLNYYDHQGNDRKRVIFSAQHKWVKTNYYNSVSRTDLVCSIVPKEINGQTAILKYITGGAYPVTLYCCKPASCDEVQRRVFARIPQPQLSALTNYGILYFADDQTINIYNQVLTEEEAKYAQEIKPEVFTTEDDISKGFMFKKDSFDVSKNPGSTFDLSEASELTDEGFDGFGKVEAVKEASVEVAPDDMADDSVFSIDKDIASAIREITENTNVHIDESLVFVPIKEETSFLDSVDSLEIPGEPDALRVPEVETREETSGSDIIDEEMLRNAIDAINSIDPVVATPVVTQPVKEVIFEPEKTEIIEQTEVVEPTVVSAPSEPEHNLMEMNDDAIDDYVQTLIDSMLQSAKEASFGYTAYSEDGFAAGAQEASIDTAQSVDVSSMAQYVSENEADAVIESNDAKYFYYGETDDNGRRSGMGKTLMADGKTAYDGMYLDDKRNGVGSFYYKNGSLCYWGDWKENLRNGFGVGVSSETGLIHCGTWRNNKPGGIGVRFDSAGKFMYLDSACEKVNGGIRVTGFTENSVIIEVYNEKTLRTVKKEISIEELLK